MGSHIRLLRVQLKFLDLPWLGHVGLPLYFYALGSGVESYSYGGIGSTVQFWSLFEGVLCQ